LCGEVVVMTVLQDRWIYVTLSWPLCNKLSSQLIRIGTVVMFVDLCVPLKCDGVRYERVKSTL